MSFSEPKHCPLMNETCLQSKCVFWVSSEEKVERNCAVVVVAQQLDILAVKGGSPRMN